MYSSCIQDVVIPMEPLISLIEFVKSCGKKNELDEYEVCFVILTSISNEPIFSAQNIPTNILFRQNKPSFSKLFIAYQGFYFHASQVKSARIL